MNWQAFGIALGFLVIGCALRAFVPYVLTGLKVIGEKGYRAWPKFEASYVSAFGIAVVGYFVMLVTVPGVAESLASTPMIAAIGLGYGGGDLAREIVKAVSFRAR